MKVLQIVRFRISGSVVHAAVDVSTNQMDVKRRDVGWLGGSHWMVFSPTSPTLRETLGPVLWKSLVGVTVSCITCH